MKFLKVKLGLVSLLAILAVSVFLTSCEQDTLISTVDALEVATEEDFNSTTANSTSPLIEDFEDEPILHANFDGNMTAEEVDVEAKKMLEDYISTLDTEELENRGVSTKWYSVLKFRTGSNTGNNTTNGAIKVTSTFRSNRGTSNHTTSTLYPGRQLGGWNVFVRRNYIPNKTVSWVEAEKVGVSFIGSDDWFVTKKQLHIYSHNQTVPANGYSRIYEYPNHSHYSPSTMTIYVARSHYNTGRLNF